MFLIELSSGLAVPDSNIALGRIVVGSFSETFEASLDFWGVSDYLASWHRSLEVLERRKNAVSCLVSSITDPDVSNFIFCWPLYRQGEDVFVQNSVIFLDSLAEPFDQARPWRSIRPRVVVNEDGDKISEWYTKMEFVRGLRNALG
jgi:hypothetical protein